MLNNRRLRLHQTSLKGALIAQVFLLKLINTWTHIWHVPALTTECAGIRRAVSRA